MSANVNEGSTVDLEDFLEQATRPRYKSYIKLDTDDCIMKKTILVYGLPGPQASSVCEALVGNPYFNVRGVFNKECPAVNTFQEKGVETEIMEITDKGGIPMLKLKHIFRGVYGVFIVTNDSEPLLAMRREMEIGLKLAEMCARHNVSHVIYSAVDYVFRITGNRCPRYDGKGEVEYHMKGMGLPLTILKLPLSYEYLLNTLLPQRLGGDIVLTGVQEGNKDFDMMNYEDIGPVVKLAFERPTVFIGKSIGLTVDRLDLNEYVRKVNEKLNEDHNHPWTYEQTTMKEYQKNKRNNRELASVLDFHCHYAPLRDVRTTQALNPNVQTFSEYIIANQSRLRKQFKV